MIPRQLVDSNFTVFVAGGTCGLGFEYAYWAAKQGACHIVLASSSGGVRESRARQGLKFLRGKQNVRVSVIKLDLLDAEKVKKCFASTQPPIKYVLHAVNRYSAGTALSRNLCLFESVQDSTWRIKVEGAQNLYKRDPRHTACPSKPGSLFDFGLVRGRAWQHRPGGLRECQSSASGSG